MRSKNIISASLKDSFFLILKNKLLFAFLLVFQIAFFVVFLYISNTYTSRIIESTQAISNYLSQLNLDESSVATGILQQKSILGEDPLSISRNFNDILKNFRIYLFYVFILLVVFVSISWALTYKFINKLSLKQLINVLFKNIIILLFYLGLIFAFFFSLLNISFTQIAAESSKLLTKYAPFLLFSVILVYFMFISLALANKIELKNIVQETLKTGIRKMHYILSIYFVNIILFGISIFLLYYFIEKNLFILLLSLILMIFSFVFGRILMVNVVEKLY